MPSLEKVRGIAATSGDCYELGRYLNRMCDEVESLREQIGRLAEVAQHCPDADPEIQALIERYAATHPRGH